MDKKLCSHRALFDACDPLESFFETCGRDRAAKILRRRCRSEEVDRSPYDARQRFEIAYFQSKALQNKSQFTLNGVTHANNLDECGIPVAENGDYFMAHEPSKHPVYHHDGKPKLRINPQKYYTKPSSGRQEKRLPKVEELFEKMDDEITDINMKQPLMSILNKPISKSPPHGILKKPKTRNSDSKDPIEGRRRQRAASESDNIRIYHVNSPTYDSRLTYLSSTTKRPRESANIGYSYGSAVQSLGSKVLTSKTLNFNNPRCLCQGHGLEQNNEHVLRTTAINSVSCDETEHVTMRDPSPPSCAPYVAAAPPPASDAPHPPAEPAADKTRRKKKRQPLKATKRRSREDSEPPPDDLDPKDDIILMETDTLMSAIKRIESTAPAPAPAPAAAEAGAAEAETLKPAARRTCSSPSALARRAAAKEEKPETVRNQQGILTALHTVNPFRLPVFKGPLQEAPLYLPPDVSTNFLRPSLFPRVPPYLKFASHEESVPWKVPIQIQKHLKWKLTTITPIVVKKTLVNSGFRLVKSDCDTSECPQEETVEWIGIWGKHMKSIMFRAIKDGQKMNHFPGSFQIGRKDRLWRNLQKLVAKYGVDEFGIMPKTYVLPHDMKLLKIDWDTHQANNEKWIIKPPASARGTGIKVISRWTQIPKKRAVVVQKYVSKPYLINGNKFDMRLYVLVTSMHPLRIYMYRDGLARFASVKYNDELASLNDRYMHLTNYSINRLSKNYTPNEDFASCEGHKWTLQTLFQYLHKEKHVDTAALWDSLKDLVVKTIISGEGSISALTKANVTSRYNCYELFGIDVLLDEDLKPWLLEVNISPSLHSASPLDIHVKGPLVTSVLNIAQYQAPSKTNVAALTKDKAAKYADMSIDNRLYTIYLSKEERDKHIIYTNMEEREMYLRDILSTLTSDDVRHLLQAEDELTQCGGGGGMERVFPTRDTHTYLRYLAGNRYYNRLFDAWETRYWCNRDSGIELLRNLCDIGYHLEVPPVPLKNDVDAASPSASEPSLAASAEAARPPDAAPGP